MLFTFTIIFFLITNTCISQRDPLTHVISTYSSITHVTICTYTKSYLFIIIQLGFFEFVLWHSVYLVLRQSGCSVNKTQHCIVHAGSVCAAVAANMMIIMYWWRFVDLCSWAYVQQHLPSQPESEYIKLPVYSFWSALWKNNQYTHNLVHI